MTRLPIPANSKVLVAPLNWGLGHASRSVPIISSLINAGCTVSIASDNDALALLRMEFPSLPSYELPSYDIHYKYHSMATNMLLQLPKILKAYKKENKEISLLQKEHQWDYIISDGRYGVRTKQTQNIFISHQLRIQSKNPIAAALATKINKSLINKFDELWIPDESDHLLSGVLSDTNGIHKYQFIGVQSRMQPLRIPVRYDIAIILSGPEPSRTHLENRLLKELKSIDKKIVVVRGVSDDVTEKELKKSFPQMEFYGRLESARLNQIISASDLIISRAGYSSIMDYYQLHKKAIMIPTPGQTEQEYLASHLTKFPLFTFIEQKDLSQIRSLLP